MDPVLLDTSSRLFGRNDLKFLDLEPLEIQERLDIPFGTIEEALQREKSNTVECLQAEKAAW